MLQLKGDTKNSQMYKFRCLLKSFTLSNSFCKQLEKYINKPDEFCATLEKMTNKVVKIKPVESGILRLGLTSGNKRSRSSEMSTSEMSTSKKARVDNSDK